MEPVPHVYTIGHSNLDLRQFDNLLHLHRVSAVADVRSSPFSRFKHFNRESLRAHLSRVGVRYVFMGAELGARSSDPSCYQDGKVSYERLATTPLFQIGITRLMDGAGTFKLAVMCSEAEPLRCHRTILISRVLIDRGLSVSHIHSDGRLEPHSLAMQRLLKMFDEPQADLFGAEDERIRRAVSMQESRIAYFNPTYATSSKAV